MTQIDAAEEILKGLRFAVVKSKRLNTSFHFTDVFVTFKFELLAFLKSKGAENELVLSQGSCLVTEDVLDLGKLFWEIESVCFESDDFSDARLNDHHLSVCLHDGSEQ